MEAHTLLVVLASLHLKLCKSMAGPYQGIGNWRGSGIELERRSLLTDDF